MFIQINGQDLVASPIDFKVKIIDIDDSETSLRTADATMTRDRIAVKRQISMKFGLLDNKVMADLLISMADIFFDVNYPDPMDGTKIIKTFYVGDRSTPVALMVGEEIYWKDLDIVLTER